MPASGERSGLGGVAVAVGAGLLMVVCRWLITVGAVILLVGAGYGLRCRVRRRRGAGPDDCCPTLPARPAEGGRET